MSTLAIVVILLAVVGGVTYLITKGKIKDENNNNIPDVVEEKIEDVKKAVEVVKETTKAVKKTADKVVKTAESVVKEVKPKTTAKKAAKK